MGVEAAALQRDKSAVRIADRRRSNAEAHGRRSSEAGSKSELNKEQPYNSVGTRKAVHTNSSPIVRKYRDEHYLTATRPISQESISLHERSEDSYEPASELAHLC